MSQSLLTESLCHVVVCALLLLLERFPVESSHLFKSCSNIDIGVGLPIKHGPRGGAGRRSTEQEQGGGAGSRKTCSQIG